MYKSFYGLSSDPFRLSPDSNFCLLHATFSRAKAYMQYALHRGEGFAVVTGRPGTGKSTLIDSLLSDFDPSELDAARLVNARLEGSDLLRMVCYAFDLSVDQAEKSELLRCLTQHMGRSVKQKKRPLLIIDEAQGLTRSALEELRLLTNLQSDGQPMLQIFLVGQDELQDLLADPRLEQVRQRITGACRLEPLKPDETVAYVVHRLRLAGWEGLPGLQSQIFPALYQFSGGIPRLINQACSRLLLHGSLEQLEELGKAAIDLVVEELRAEHISIPTSSVLIDLEDFDAAALQAVAAASIPLQRTPEPPEESVDLLNSQMPATPLATPLQEPAEPLMPLLPASPEADVPPASAVRQDSVTVNTVAKPAVAWSSSAWGLAASLVLALMVFATSLFSAPRHELERLAPDALWGYLGVEQIRGLVSDWTGGNWPLRGSGDSVDRMPESEPGPQAPAEKIAQAAVSLNMSPVLAPLSSPEPVAEPPEKVAPTQAERMVIALPTDQLPDMRAEQKRVVWTPAGQIPFGFDSIEIKPEHYQMLDTLARILNASRKNSARIVGYTDSTGPAGYNDTLSERRAEAVADYIRAKGVLGKQLKIEGRGGSHGNSGDPVGKDTVRAVKIYFEPANSFTQLISYDPE